MYITYKENIQYTLNKRLIQIRIFPFSPTVNGQIRL